MEHKINHRQHIDKWAYLQSSYVIFLQKKNNAYSYLPTSGLEQQILNLSSYQNHPVTAQYQILVPKFLFLEFSGGLENLILKFLQFWKPLV